MEHTLGRNQNGYLRNQNVLHNLDDAHMDVVATAERILVYNRSLDTIQFANWMHTDDLYNYHDALVVDIGVLQVSDTLVVDTLALDNLTGHTQNHRIALMDAGYIMDVIDYMVVDYNLLVDQTSHQNDLASLA